MFNSNERKFVALAIFALISTSLYDMFADYNGGENISALFVDFIVSLILGIPLLYIWFLQPITAWSTNRLLALQAKRNGVDIKYWSGIASKQRFGLSQHIDAQFHEWHLTPAERDVALLLLKGFSMREIAELRKNSERTTRQQATTIYAKANVDGRAALSAFFLEDLLPPAEGHA
jgi:DNA-binding CsgD family transcriptional regulator